MTGEGGGDVVDPVVELGEREAGVAVDEGEYVAVPGRGASEEVAERVATGDLAGDGLALMGASDAWA